MKMDEMIDLKCEKCGADYSQPKNFIKWNKETPNVFFKWSLKFCDKCRRKKQHEALKSLPTIIDALTTPNPETK